MPPTKASRLISLCAAYDYDAAFALSDDVVQFAPVAAWGLTASGATVALVVDPEKGRLVRATDLEGFAGLEYTGEDDDEDDEDDEDLDDEDLDDAPLEGAPAEPT